MLCYCCAKEGTDRPAIALCRGCSAGLCMTHLRQTTGRLATSNLFAYCGHDTLIATTSPVAEVTESGHERVRRLTAHH